MLDRVFLILIISPLLHVAHAAHGAPDATYYILELRIIIVQTRNLLIPLPYIFLEPLDLL